MISGCIWRWNLPARLNQSARPLQTNKKRKSSEQPSMIENIQGWKLYCVSMKGPLDEFAWALWVVWHSASFGLAYVEAFSRLGPVLLITQWVQNKGQVLEVHGASRNADSKTKTTLSLNFQHIYTSIIITTVHRSIASSHSDWPFSAFFRRSLGIWFWHAQKQTGLITWSVMLNIW